MPPAAPASVQNRSLPAGALGARRVIDVDCTPVWGRELNSQSHAWSDNPGHQWSARSAEFCIKLIKSGGDDYASAAKPQVDWDDKDAQADLVDSRAKDAYACLASLDGSELGPSVEEAARLLATVLGQDLEVDGEPRLASPARWPPTG